MPGNESIKGGQNFSPETPAGAVSDVATALAQALGQMDVDGRLEAVGARALRQAVAQLPLGIRKGHRPEPFFGPFNTLSPATQRAIVQAIEADDRWRMAGYEMGNWHIATTRLLRKVCQSLPKRLSVMRELVMAGAVTLQNGPARGSHALYRWQLGWCGKYASRPTLAAWLQAAGIELRQLAVCYAREIFQLDAYRGFWHDPVRQNTVGVVLGIDLLPSPNGYWFIESNLDCALRLERTALYDHDPFVTNLLDFAAVHGYHDLIVMAGNSSRIDALMVKQYEEGAAARKLKLTLVEDVYLPYSRQARSFGIPPFLNEKTLIVRIKYYRTSLDYVFQHKWASNRALNMYQICTKSSDPALLLPSVGTEPVLGNADPDEPFPNLVYKFPERDSGSGVIFLKATSPAHAQSLLAKATTALRPHDLRGWLYSIQDDHNGLYQPYIRSHLLAGRRLYIIRAHVLVTPVGLQFLSAHRVISGCAVPEQLPMGVVHDSRPYLVNYSAGAKYEVVPQDEEEAVRTAALAVAKGLSWAIAHGFRTFHDETS